MIDEEVFFEVRGSLGLITQNRPKALNALTLSMVREIHPKLEEWESNPSVKNVLIKAEGEKAFCAGGDIRALHDWVEIMIKKQQGFTERNTSSINI